MRELVKFRSRLVLALVLAWSGSARAVELVPWLYQVAVPVADQSTAERERASSAALLGLLTRLTGLAYVPRTEEVTAALNAADGYYSEFRFAAAASPSDAQDQEGHGDVEGKNALDLVIQFDPDPVLALIRAAGLPIWRATRERVLVWVAIKDAGQRSLIGATSDLPLVAGLTAQARARGLHLDLPLLDMEDQLAVDPAAVWGRLSQVVDPASRRYDADVLLLGRIERDASGVWISDWEFWVDGVVVPFSAQGSDLAVHAGQAVDVLADELASRRVVYGRPAAQLRVAVAGVNTPADYGALLNYLRSLEFVEQVGVSGIHNQRLWLTIDTTAGAERLLTTFVRDRRLFDDQLARIDAADLRVIWRSGD